MDIFYTFKARKDLEKLSRDIQKRIARKMRFFASQRDLLKFAERLVDSREGEFRFRIGDWRIFFDVVKDKVFVLKIKHRSKAYE